MTTVRRESRETTVQLTLTAGTGAAQVATTEPFLDHMLVALARWVAAVYGEVQASEADRAQHLTAAVQPAIAALAQRLAQGEWSAAAISATFKQVLADHGLKMPQLAMPVRVLVMGTAQTPSVDAVLELQNRGTVIARLQKA